MQNTVTQKMVDDIFSKAEKKVYTMFDKCTVVCVKLENGFVLTESSACVDPANYNEELGKEICFERIKNKIWELEGYRLQCDIFKEE